MFKHFAESMIGGRAFTPMYNADGGAGAGGASGSDDPGQSGGQAGAGANDQGQGGAAGADDQGQGQGQEVKFTPEQQEFINNLIGKTVKSERTKAEAERKRLEEMAKMDEAGKLKLQLEDAQKKITESNKEILNSKIERAALSAGVPAKKLARFVKVVDRDGIETDGAIDEQQIEAAVKATLDDMPEFKASENSKGPGGEGFSGGGPDKAKYTMAQIKAMDPKEIAADYDEVMKSMRYHQNSN